MLAHQAGAQTAQWWDNNGASNPSSGTWDTTTTNWANSSTLTASTVAFTNGNFPIFTASSSTNLGTLTVTVPGAVTCEGLGNGTTSGGSASGSYVTNLIFNGAGSINLPSGAWPFECGNGPAPGTIINVPITGPGGIIQHNSGTLYLYGNNSYSGGTTATGGQIINYNNNNSFGTGPITNSTGSTSLLTTNSSTHIVTLANPFYMNSGTAVFNFGSGNTISTGPWYLGTTTQLKDNGGTAPLTLSGAISSVGGAYGLTLETPGGATITLSGPNTYIGPTAIGVQGATTTVSVSSINSVNTPAQQASSSLGVPSSAANGTIAMASTTFAGKLVYTGPGETSDRVINLAGTTGGAIIEMDGAGPLVLTSPFTTTGNGIKTLTLQGSSTAANTISGAIVNSTSATTLTKAQAGSWILAGNNTFTGPITNSGGGTLTIGGSGDLGDSGGNGSYTGIITNSATFVYASSAAQTLSGVISGPGSLQQIGSGNLTLSAANTYTGATTIGNGSTLIVSGTGKLATTTPIALNGTLDINSTAGMTVGGLLSGSGAYNLAATATETITNVNNTFSGLFSVTAGIISFNADSCLGTPPASFLANDITLNGGTPSGLRANAAGITINPNRGITLGANGGEIQVAGNDTCTYNGVISGSGAFQNGQNATTGLGVLVLGGIETYTGATIMAAGTLRLSATGSLANSSGIIMSNSATFDVSGQNPFALSPNNTSFTAIGGATTTTTIIGPLGGNVNFGSQPVNLTFVPSMTSGDPTNAALNISQGTLVLNGNTINVNNASALTLDVGNYTLITGNISVTSPLTLNYSGPGIAANTTASLVVVGNSLMLQIVPAAGYTGSVFSNLTHSQSVTYGTATATVSGTVSAAGPTYPVIGETITITIPNVLTTNTTINDAIGDFTLTMPINTLPVGTGVITYSYAGPTLAPTMDTSTTFTITKAPVTVTATAQSKTYGQTITFGAGNTNFTATGLMNGDTIGSVTLAVSGTPGGGVSNAPVSGSPYTITPSAATSGTFNANNYTITYVTGSLTVNPLPVALTGTRPYDGTSTAASSILSITNIVGTDVVTLASGSATLAGSTVGVEPIISASGLTLGGAAAGNYTTTSATGAVTITANQPFSIISIQIVATNAVVVFQSVPGVSYQMLSTTNLVEPLASWVNAGPATIAVGALTTNIVPVSSANTFFTIKN